MSNTTSWAEWSLAVYCSIVAIVIIGFYIARSHAAQYALPLFFFSLLSHRSVRKRHMYLFIEEILICLLDLGLGPTRGYAASSPFPRPSPSLHRNHSLSDPIPRQL